LVGQAYRLANMIVSYNIIYFADNAIVLAQSANYKTLFDRHSFAVFNVIKSVCLIVSSGRISKGVT